MKDFFNATLSVRTRLFSKEWTWFNFVFSLGLIIDENLSWKAHIHEISKKKYLLVSVLFSESGYLFQCTLQLKYTKILSSHTSIIAALYGMAWPNRLVRNFKIVLSELSLNLALIRWVPDILVETIYRLEGLNKRLISCTHALTISPQVTSGICLPQ